LNEGDPLLQDIRVVEVATGDSRTLVEGTVIAFFWSPDGSRLAYVTTNAGGTALQWRVVDAATGEDREVADFFPSSDLLIWLTYFDQYAYSHQVWSPDSRYLVFAGTLANENAAGGRASQVFVLDVDGAEPPLALAEGLLASWSQV
jgi:TolB protein